MNSQGSEIECPVCGAPAPHRLRYAKLLVCEHCKTPLFLDGDAVRHAGERSALVDEPSIFSIGNSFRYRNWVFEVFGRIRYDYGGGYWDEWWVVLESGAGKWVSVDEGDIAVENPIEAESALPAFADLGIGRPVSIDGKGYQVTEMNRAVCVGAAGELPEVTNAGDEHDYAHLSGPGGQLVTLEYAEGETHAFQGAWIDPFDVQALG